MNSPPPVATSSDIESQHWDADYRLRVRDADLKERNAVNERMLKRGELRAKIADQKWARWMNPLVLAIFAAAFAGVSNALLVYLNSSAQITLEREKAGIQKGLEETKAEASRIFEVIKTADPDKAATNLEFLLQAGLITDPDRKKSLQEFLAKRQPGEGPNIPPPGATASVSNPPSYNLPMVPENPLQSKAATRLLNIATAEINKNVDEDGAIERIQQYWRTVNMPAPNVRNQPWSGAFLSWLIKESGNGDRLATSPLNLNIWNDGVRKKLTFAPNEKPVLPGDIVLFTRLGSGNASMNDLRAGRVSNATTASGVVYAVAPNTLSVIMGNMGNAIRLREVTLPETTLIGFLRLSDSP